MTGTRFTSPVTSPCRKVLVSLSPLSVGPMVPCPPYWKPFCAVASTSDAGAARRQAGNSSTPVYANRR